MNGCKYSQSDVRILRQAEETRYRSLRITKEGGPYLRTILVQGVHYIISRRGPDTDLKRWGLRLGERGGKRGKKKAVGAVARKLGILLHRLWVSGEVYEPLRNQNLRKEQKKAA